MSSIRWHFFFSVIPEKSFASRGHFSLVECVAVWALKLPVPHTDVLKPTSHKSFSPELLESKGTDSEHLTRAPTILPRMTLHKWVCGSDATLFSR